MERRFVGRNGDLVLTDTGVRIVRGLKGALAQFALRGDKHIPYESIVAVQFKEAGLSGYGYLQLSLRGGSEAKAGLIQSYRDENTVRWGWVPRGANSEFAEARDLILARIAPEPAETKVCPQCAESVKAAAVVCRYCGHRFDDRA